MTPSTRKAKKSQIAADSSRKQRGDITLKLAEIEKTIAEGCGLAVPPGSLSREWSSFFPHEQQSLEQFLAAQPTLSEGIGHVKFETIVSRVIDVVIESSMNE